MAADKEVSTDGIQELVKNTLTLENKNLVYQWQAIAAAKAIALPKGLSLAGDPTNVDYKISVTVKATEGYVLANEGQTFFSVKWWLH